VWSDVRSAAGRLFQVDGPKTAKRRWPMEVRDHGTCKTTVDAERRLELVDNEHDSFSAVDAHIFPELVQTILERVDC